MNHTNYGVISTEAAKEINEKITNGDVEMGIDLALGSDTSIINGEIQEKKETEDQRGGPIAVLLKESNIRSTPSRENMKNFLFSLPAGTEVVVMAQNEEWSNICTEAGIEGHVLTTLLEFKMKEE